MQKLRLSQKNRLRKKLEGTKVLFAGYNGANNTGSEARLLSIVEDVRSTFGKNVPITVPTLNERNLRRYLKDDYNLKIRPVRSLFFRDVKRLVREHDVVLLVEGSCYMDTWTSALLWLFLWTTRCAHKFGKPVIAYSVDAGSLSPLNCILTRREASKTDLIITRSPQARKMLLELGVSAPIETTADCALTYFPLVEEDFAAEDFYDKPERGLIGLAAIDFYCWPVVIRPWGQKEFCYRWPYYFSHSSERKVKTVAYAQKLAGMVDRFVSECKKNVALICMEEVDEKMAKTVVRMTRNSEKVRVFSSRSRKVSFMTSLLQSLDLLITSRYHASVLSLPGLVPQVAIGHDTRLSSLYEELNLDNYFFDPGVGDHWTDLETVVSFLLGNPGVQRGDLAAGFAKLKDRAEDNRKILRNFVEEYLYGEP
jgi:polysaccharide pyruvyl transferase WcaK-like protein